MQIKKNNANGKHLIIDLYQANHLDDLERIKRAINEIISVTGATLLFENFHSFEPSGITGVACLAESHISVHTWPEDHYAAFDVFMCGDTKPELATQILIDHFGGEASVKTILRGSRNGQ